MKAAIAAAVLLSMLARPAVAVEPTTQTFNANIEHVWKTTHAVLRQLGWDIDREDRSIGWITTESRRVEGEDYGVYAKGMRHRLTIQVKGLADTRTSVSVEREVFKRERILWIDKDEPVIDADRAVPQALLDAIGKAL